MRDTRRACTQGKVKFGFMAPQVFHGSSIGVKLTKLFLNKDLFQFKYRNRDGGAYNIF